MQLKQLLYFVSSCLISCIAVSCGNSTEASAENADRVEESPIANDSMLYGLACDGTTDSTIIIYPFSGGEPLTFSCIDAYEAGRIIGKPTIGDWIGVVKNKDIDDEVDMVVNLDLLKGTWTYPVMPVLKDFKHLSKRMQLRMQKKAMAEMPDSVKEMYMVAREYGFSLKRAHVAQPVGNVFSGSTLEDDSPVEYPKVQNYRHWYTWNGHLILVSSKNSRIIEAKDSHQDEIFDTLDFVSLTNDSLVLSHKGVRYGFHRKLNAMTANADAQKKAQQVAEKKANEELK